LLSNLFVVPVAAVDVYLLFCLDVVAAAVST
jgi:hypothetical protein